MKKKEWYYLLGTMSGGICLGILLLGRESLQPDSLTSFHFYDTYYAIPSFYALIALIVLAYFLVYLGRMLYSNFRITVVNLVFIAATFLMMTLICGLTTLLRDSLSGSLDTLDVADSGNWKKSLHNLLTITQGFLLGLLAISGIKTLQHLRTRFFY